MANRPATPSADSISQVDPRDVDHVARDSLRTWAKATFGAPRRIDKMVTLLRQDEQDFIRIATEIHRREIAEVRAPAPPDAHRRPAAPIFFDLRTVDPWSISPDEMRTATEKVDTCAVCQGSAAAPCAPCAGTGRARCSTCNGSGNAVQGGGMCPLCAGAGSIGCGACSTRGVAPCVACSGSGMQTVYLTYEQQARLDIKLVPPDSPVARLYSQLGERKVLTRTDLAPFVVYAATLSSGAIASGALPYDEFERLQKHKPQVDARLERVSQQQYVRFGAVRRELAYEMAGTRGRITLAGASCAVELSPDAMKPIRMRLLAWFGGGLFSALLLMVIFLAMRGSTVYFRNWNIILGFLFVVAAGGLIGGIGAALRVLGVGLKLQRPFPIELAYPAALGAAIFGIVVVKGASHPTVAEAHAVIQAGNAQRAAIVIDALDVTGADPSEVSALRDDLAILEAQKLSGDERVARLDEIAGQGGTRAADAAKLAREDKLARVRALVAAKKLPEALDLADHIFVGADRELPEVQEVRAIVYESELTQCGADPCRYLAARKAERANPSPERAARTRDLRMKLLDMIAIEDRPSESTLERLKRARTLEANAQQIAGVVGDDAELQDHTRAAQKWAQTAREAVPLLGSGRPVLEELLGTLDEQDDKLHTVLEGVAIYIVLDKAREACTGVYIVGESKDTRQQGLKIDYMPSLLLAKAVGRPAQVRAPPKHQATAKDPPPTMTSWLEGATNVVARWRDGVFVEMRIGDASPAGDAKPGRPGNFGRAPLLTFTAFPGGQILLDNVLLGKDSVGPLRVRPGKHEVKVKNRFLGDNVHPIEVKDGQNDDIVMVW